MTTIPMDEFSQLHILIYEPRVEGHHLTWLRYITEDLLSAGFRLTLAVDCRSEQYAMIREHLSTLISEVDIMSIRNDGGKLHAGSKIRALAHCFNESAAQEVFVNNIDEVGSHLLRFAAAGIYPPELLRGHLSGVYFRPRFLLNSSWPLGNIIKSIGFRRLCKQRWFQKIYLMDEYLAATMNDQDCGAKFHFLPDPWHGDFTLSQSKARKALKLPSDRFIFLNYGIGARRKGLHLVVRSMLDSSSETRSFLLCAGQIAKDRQIADGLMHLKKRGLARVMDYYVSDYEEKLCFCASSVVLLPYIKHFGSSGVLSRAAAAGRMVIAPEGGLIGERVREHRLGLLFTSGKAKELKKCMDEATSLSRSALAEFRNAALAYASLCTREAFRKALLLPYDVKMTKGQCRA
jgi:glycosyltransferase involved in cell wall biosynthesis